jgi:endonuclease/exonuclease/phosphatase family metal-dependent hydrolase
MRTMLMADITDSATGQLVRFFGIHLDDRSEASRLHQIQDLVPLINASSLPLVALGDFNAMHSTSIAARFLRNQTVLSAINLLPHTRIQNILGRLSEMAVGDAMQVIEDSTSLVDVDPRRQPTTTPKMRDQEWMPSIRMAQIDHILISPEIGTSDYRVAHDGGSDHRAISVTIHI